MSLIKLKESRKLIADMNEGHLNFIILNNQNKQGAKLSKFQQAKVRQTTLTGQEQGHVTGQDQTVTPVRSNIKWTEIHRTYTVIEIIYNINSGTKISLLHLTSLYHLNEF